MLSQLGSPTRDSNSSGSSKSDPTVFRQIRPNSKDQGKKCDVNVEKRRGFRRSKWAYVMRNISPFWASHWRNALAEFF